MFSVIIFCLIFLIEQRQSGNQKVACFLHCANTFHILVTQTIQLQFRHQQIHRNRNFCFTHHSTKLIAFVTTKIDGKQQLIFTMMQKAT